jgi:hypothetical protein
MPPAAQRPTKHALSDTDIFSPDRELTRMRPQPQMTVEDVFAKPGS